MTIASDQYGTFGTECSVGAYFNPDGEIGSTDWQCVGSLLLTDGQNGYWLADENDPQRLGVLTDDLVISDTVNDTRTARTSSFRVPLADLQVDLVQETPTAGYNFLQNYTFTNKSGQPLSLNIVWFNDQDPHFTGPILPVTQHVGFVPGEIPRAYFIEEADVAGPGDPGITDRNYRISVAARMADGVTFDGYLGVKESEPGRGATDVLSYLGQNLGIREVDLNRIQLSRFGSPAGEFDMDGNLLTDTPGDVAGAMQFSLDLAAGASSTLALDYIGGSLSNAVFPLLTMAGDFNGDGILSTADIDRLNAIIRADRQNMNFDVSGDGRVTLSDREFWVRQLKKTYFGDANLDGEFNSSDMISVFQAGQYEDTLVGNSGWSSGDWDGDGDFTTGDLVAAFQDGGYEKSPQAALVPEPCSWFMLLIGFGLAWNRNLRPCLKG
jgi:hypothetical protein